MTKFPHDRDVKDTRIAELEAEVQRLHDKYDFQKLVKRVERYEEALESLNFWRCTACEENMKIRDEALADKSWQQDPKTVWPMPQSPEEQGREE